MKNLASKLLKVMQAVQSVNKSGYNEHHKYKYVTEAAILEVIRKELIANKVFLFSDVVSSSRTGNLTSVRVAHTFVDAESGETHTVHGEGQGADNQDKGIYKALTGENKYFLMKNLQLPTTDDPEREEVLSSETTAEGPAAGVKAAVAAKSTPKPASFKKPSTSQQSNGTGNHAITPSVEGEWA